MVVWWSLFVIAQFVVSQNDKCTSAFDCSYNGDCVDHTCKCAPQWNGVNCDALNLLPTNKSSGYQYTLDSQRVSSWGGSVVYDNATGIYHMYAAEISEFCGIDVWQPNSILVHAQSEPRKPLGAYMRMEEIDDIFSHEPNAIKDPSSGWLHVHIYTCTHIFDDQANLSCTIRTCLRRRRDPTTRARTVRMA